MQNLFFVSWSNVLTGNLNFVCLITKRGWKISRNEMPFKIRNDIFFFEPSKEYKQFRKPLADMRAPRKYVKTAYSQQFQENRLNWVFWRPKRASTNTIQSFTNTTTKRRIELNPNLHTRNSHTNDFVLYYSDITPHESSQCFPVLFRRVLFFRFALLRFRAINEHERIQKNGWRSELLLDIIFFSAFSCF